MSSDGARASRARRAWDRVASAHDRGGVIETRERGLAAGAALAMGLRAGSAVLDVGCGAGNAFAELSAAVGETGRVVGIDVSPKMVARARARIHAHGWTNVEVRLADISGTELEPDAFDGAVALFALSTVPDLGAALDRIHAALRPGCALFFCDAHFRPGPPQLLRSLYRLACGANGDDIPAAARARFATVTPVDGAKGGPAPHGERSWPPVAAGLATKAARAMPPRDRSAE